MAKHHFTDMGKAVEYCRKQREARKPMQMDVDLRLMSGQHAENARKVKEQNKRDALKSKKKAKDEPGSESKNTVAAQ